MVKKEKSKPEIVTGLDPEVMAVVGAICNKYKDPSALVCLGDQKGCVVTRNLTSAGSLCIDRAVGVLTKDENGSILHGIPRGRIVEIMGWEGCGKCLTKDMNILTADGYKTIEEIFNENNIELSSKESEYPIKYKLVNMNGDIEETTHFVCNGLKKVYSTKTKSGTIIKSTSIHPMLIIDDNGCMKWVKTCDLKVGDILIGRKGDEFFGSDDSINNEHSYVIGLMVADSYFGKNRISFTNNDKTIVELFNKVIKTFDFMEDYEIKTYERNNTIEHHINKRAVIENIYKKYGIHPGVAKDKTVPEIILHSSKSVQKYFLMGYYDCESSIEDNSICVTSASCKLLNDIKLMLLNFGIKSTLTSKKVKKYKDNTYYVLSIFSDNIDTFVDEIGFLSENRIKSVGSFINKKVGKVIPNINKPVVALYNSFSKENKNRYTCGLIKDVKSLKCDISSNRLNKILKIDDGIKEIKEMLSFYSSDNVYFDEVVEIKEYGEEPTFDFSMSETHSFIVNGIINHNTTLLNHMIAETQKQGKLAAIIDVEQTWDKNYAANIGVDVDKLLFSQPSYAEQALDILDSLIKTGKFGIICFDSVAALCPKAELDGNVGDNSIGVVAKLMSQVLRKINNSVNRTDTLVVFTNQYRDKIGVMYGSSQTTTGGNSLRFYSSVRIEMSKIGLLKDASGDVIGNRCKVKIQKNKVAAPFKVCEFDILYGIGIDRTGEIVDLACDFGIMKKKGAWIEYSGNNIGQGRMATANSLRENSALCNAITNEILEKMYEEIYGSGESDAEEIQEDCVSTDSEE